MDDSLYEKDFYTWADRQVGLLRSGNAAMADLVNIAEEIETLGRSEAAALESAYRLIAMHLLKLLYQPEKATSSWSMTIGRERIRLMRTLRQNPGLKPKRLDLFTAAYDDARKEAALETGLPLKTFPFDPPFGLDDTEDEGFWPSAT